MNDCVESEDFRAYLWLNVTLEEDDLFNRTRSRTFRPLCGICLFYHYVKDINFINYNQLNNMLAKKEIPKAASLFNAYNKKIGL